MVKNKFSVVDLFCGCGGLSLGFMQEGYRILLGIDNDKASIETYKRNHPESAVILKDILEVKNEDIRKKLGSREVNVIIGGPPCQGLSLSGPRKYDDPRNRLFLSFVRVTSLLKPEAIVLENVPGLIRLYKGRVKSEIINEFSNIGYKMSVKVLVAADFGVPQLRKRVIFVGLRNKDLEFSYPEPSYYPQDTMFGKKYVTTEEALGDLPSLEKKVGENKQIYASKPQNEFQKMMRRKSNFLYNHIGTIHTERVRKIISLVPEGGDYKDLPDRYRNSRNFHVAWTRFHSKKPAPTIDTGHRHHFHHIYNRVPTVRECARLQSFPDNFIFYGNKTEQYRQVGNAVPVLLAKAVAERLNNYL